MTDMPKAEQGGSRWAKTLHDELGPELVRRWNEYEPMRAEIARLRAALRAVADYMPGGDHQAVLETVRRALEPKP